MPQSLEFDRDRAIVEKHLEWQFGTALSDPARTAEFGDVVCVFTELLQESPIQSVLVRLKGAMSRGYLAAVTDNRPHPPLDRFEGLKAAAVRRAIEHYYGSPHSDPLFSRVHQQTQTTGR